MVVTDEELLARMAGGDEEAFVTLYRRRQGAVYRFALRMTGNPGVAEEVTQETFLVLIRDAGRWDARRGTLASWLFGVARNHVLRTLERDGRYVAGDGLEEMPSAEDTLGALTRGQDVEALRGALLSLPAHYREVAVLCGIEEMSYEEAARAIGCAVGTVRSRLARARGMLAGKMRAMRCAS